MCGIFGAIGSATDEILASGAAALHHRGPDAHGLWRDGRDGLAHARLRIIDLSEAGAQPMAGCDARVRVTFNGEIYNHRELREELESRGHRFRSRSDTEPIVHGYEEWGPAVVERLDGIFSLGLWDARARRLVLARDRSGKKSLFYTVSDDNQALSFGSEIKALVAAGHDDALDPAALPMLLAYGYVPAPSTLHRGVRQLPPASRLVFRPGHAPVVDEYWRPTFLDTPLALAASTTHNTVTVDDASRRVRELLVAAVERRLEADVPLGAFLSGGVDSTIIVGILSRLLGRPLKTFSIGFSGDPAYDETPFARQAARAFFTDHTEFTVSPSSFELVEKLVELHDGPFGDSSAVPTYTVAKLTREHVTVALTGDGGDELFAGYLRFLAAEAAERVPQSVRGGLSRLAGAAARWPGGLSLRERSLPARARRFLDGAALPLGDRLARWTQLFDPSGAGGGDALLRPELARSLDLLGPRAYQRSFFPSGSDGSDGNVPTPLARILDHNFRTYLAADLQQKVDRCTAGVGLEARSPFLDTALMEYVGRLPDDLKRRRGRTKWILRHAFADLLPRSIDRRGKMGFGMPLATWMRGPLRPMVADLLGPASRINDLLQRNTVARLLAEHQAGEDRSARLWLLITLEVWLRALAAPKAARLGTPVVRSPRSRIVTDESQGAGSSNTIDNTLGGAA